MLTRRSLLQGAFASAALVGLAKQGWGQQAWQTNPFTMGIASGSPDSSSVVLWTRLDPQALEAAGLTDKAVDVVWQLAHDEGFTKIAAKGIVSAQPALGHSVHAEVNGLEPARQYFYRFLVGEAVTSVGRTRTFPRADAAVDRLRLSYASCQRWGDGYYSAYHHMSKEDLDFVFFLGDYIYEYPASIPPIRETTGGWVNTLQDYRARYALHKSDLNLQAAHAAFPWMMIWDDHEVQNDYAGEIQGRSGAAVTDFPARRLAAYQAYYENMPVRRASFDKLLTSQSKQVRLFDRIAYGRLANLFTLDDRQYRDRQVCNADNAFGSGMVEADKCAVWKDPKRTLLGFEQETWLKNEFAGSKAQWNIIAQQTLFGQRASDIKGTEKFWNDGWDGYTAARQRMIGSIVDTKLTNPIMLGGDVHDNWVGHIKADYNDPASATIGAEFCGTSITTKSGAKQAQLNQSLVRNPHFIFANTEYRGYGTVDFTQKGVTTTLKGMKDITDPKSDSLTLAKFFVANGKSDIQTL